jgi:hypothetical protein
MCAESPASSNWQRVGSVKVGDRAVCATQVDLKRPVPDERATGRCLFRPDTDVEAACQELKKASSGVSDNARYPLAVIIGHRVVTSSNNIVRSTHAGRMTPAPNDSTSIAMAAGW